MGERTLTMVTTINEHTKQKKTFAYYNQWGIGRIQLNAIMGNYMAQFSKLSDHAMSKYEPFTPFNLSGTESMHDELDQILEDYRKWEANHPNSEKCVLKGRKAEDLNIEDIKDCKLLLEGTDNNDGGICFTLHYIPDERGISYGYDMKATIGFILGDAQMSNNQDPFKKFVSFDTWAKRVGGERYVDANFKSIFNSFCKHFDVTVLK